MHIEFKTNFRGWLENHRWKPKELAENLGVSRQTIHHWMDGSSTPKNEEVIRKLYKLGGDNLITFMNRDDKPRIAKPRAYFEIEGGTKISGEIRINGAKNAALPMLCAALLTPEKCTFLEVPNITDIDNLLTIFEDIGVSVNRYPTERKVEIEAKKVDLDRLADLDDVRKFRASLLMLGPILSRFGQCEILMPGGCVIGARSNYIHTDGLQLLGAEVEESDDSLKATFDREDLKSKRILLSEASVTGTENLAMFLAGQNDTAEIYFSAAEPHVCATLEMLNSMGAMIEGIGTHHLKIKGTKMLKGGTFTIPTDGLLVGTYAIAALLTQGELMIKNVNHRELFSFYGLLKRLGAQFEMLDDALHVLPSPNLKAIPKVQTAIYPGFSTDLQSPLGVLLTQCEGDSLLFETLFENRLTYLLELEKMGAKVQILNPHQARISGKVKLRAAEVQSWDLRAGAAMVLAGLIAEGYTKVTNIDYIDRGYEDFVENLNSLGAHIERVET
ncbi:UDP-N-acetylglucosamine 1-carboxyvinyltransferase [bacterium]|nr:UDP-N-acetylglucosamine 1-carboxyvinyltransferase [bacterium]NCQ55169.1 UDP-N-acetylglucosamine 1-carboxyvinyltransferase [Candidatus Parcubacteria bacterium]NCS67318.1 UDP-N-acetylglucosamine 1-carboxyvinyltransferase [Candidatus Peregrinibacteria bacterium]NCS96573.1 UDP-N-acetylglucosamine 1-carboxyvinyltransferase [bacterium]